MPRGCAWVAAASALLARDVSAHHSVLKFDGTRGVTLDGAVARVLWQNPHTMLAVDVTGEDGSVVRWVVESESPLVLVRLGWTGDAIAAGDSIVVIGAPARDGSRALRCQRVTLADGRTLACFP